MNAGTAAILASMTSLLVAIGGVVTGVYMMRANRRRQDAGARLDNAQAEHATAQARFEGTVFIRDLSESAVAMVATLRGENNELRDRINKLESALEQTRSRVEVVETENLNLVRELHAARERLSTDQDRFQRQMRELMIRHRGRTETPPGPPST